MLGRKTYTPEELDHARSTIAELLGAYRKLAKAIGSGPENAKARAALEAFEPRFASTLVLALDRPFVHRLRSVTGKDGNPLNEVELLTESLMNKDGVLRGNNVIRFVSEDSVLGLAVGDRITLSAAQLEHLAKAFYADLEAKYL